MSNGVPQGTWRPKSYPAQTWTEDALHNRSGFASEQSQPLKLPQTIRAVQDSNGPYLGKITRESFVSFLEEFGEVA
jgi:hypothetical protein